MDYGFDTYAGFYKAFQREFGITPGAFLKTCRAGRPCRLNLLHRALEKAEKSVNDTDLYETVSSWALPKVREVLDLPDGLCRDWQVDSFEMLRFER